MTLLATGTVQLTTINCGNTVCEYPYETNSNCPTDCHCGDGYCYPDYENYASCADDCAAPTEVVPIKKEEVPIAPPLPPTKINETIQMEGVPFVHIYADFKTPLEGASVSVEYIDCEILQKMLYGGEIPFKCFFLRAENIPEVAIENATIISKARRDWIDAYNINLSTVKLLRFSRNQRTDLPTEPITPDDPRFFLMEYDMETYQYFISYTPGFSFFLLVGEPMEPKPPVVERPQPYCGDDICDATIGEGCSTCHRDCSCNPGYDCVSNQCVRECLLFGITFGRFLGICWYWWLLLLLVIAVFYLVWRREKRRAAFRRVMILVILSIIIAVAMVAVKMRPKKKSRWQRFLDAVKSATEGK